MRPLAVADGYPSSSRRRATGRLDSPANPGAVTVHQDAAVYATLLDPSHAVNHRFRDGFQGYLFVVHGDIHVATDGDAGELAEGGAAKLVDVPEVNVRARDAGAELLLVETRAVDRSG